MKVDLILRNKKKENKVLVELMMLIKKREIEYMNIWVYKFIKMLFVECVW